MDTSHTSYSKSKLRRFAFLCSIAIIVLFVLIPYLREPSRGLNAFILIASFSISIIAVIKPYSLRSFYIAWLKLGDWLGKFNSRLILGAFFFLVITPVALVVRFSMFVLKLTHISKDSSSFRRPPALQISTFSDQH